MRTRGVRSLGLVLAGLLAASCQAGGIVTGSGALGGQAPVAPWVPRFHLTAAPSNDDIANATALVVDGVPRVFSVAEATNAPDDPAPNCWGSVVPQSIWFAYDAPEGGPEALDIQVDGSDYPPNLFAFEGTPTNENFVICNWTAGDGRSVRSKLPVEPGRRYYLLSGALMGPVNTPLTLTARSYVALTAAFTINPTATVDTRTGEVTISGTLTTNQVASGVVGGSVDQKGGRLLMHGDFGAAAGPTPEAGTYHWSAVTRAQAPYIFGPGKAQVYANVQVSTQIDSVFLEARSGVRIVAKR